jgi:hypothetical protein
VHTQEENARKKQREDNREHERDNKEREVRIWESKHKERSRSRQREDPEFIIKNGCCRECMKAFSKTGKVINLSIVMYIRVVYAKCLECKEDQPCHHKDASIAVARAAIQ